MLLTSLLIGNILLAFTHGVSKSLYHQIEHLATTFAPIFWLHSEEIYFPSSVEFHLQYCTLRNSDEKVMVENVTIENVITGKASYSLHLNTLLTSPQSGDLPFFKGQPLDTIPVYTFVRIIKKMPLELEIKYDLFFPYNRGKDVCEGIRVDNGCVGRKDSFGHHVGDWEGITIHVKNESIAELYMSVHSFGAYYRWNGTKYGMYYGEDVGSSFIPFDYVDPDYPLCAIVHQQQTPVVFVANGSHGMWSEAGRHYFCKEINLYDETNEGVKLVSGDKLKLYIWDDNNRPEGEWRWLDYRGLYGNLEQGCQLKFIAGECNLHDGPRGPSSPPHSFPAPNSKRKASTGLRKTESSRESPLQNT